VSRAAGRAGWRGNWGLKALSVLLAFGVWVYVNSQGQVTVNFAVPIEVTGIPAEMVLSEMSEETVDVRVKGRESALGRLGSQNLHVFLDLSGVAEGEQWVTLSPADVKATQPLEVTRVSPRQVRVRVEPRVTQSVKVVADVTGQPAPGRHVDAIRVEPPVVTVTGAASAFEGLTRLSTQPLDLTGLTESIRREARLDLRGRDLELLEPRPLYVRITLSPNAAGGTAPAP